MMCFDEKEGSLLWQLVIAKIEGDVYKDWKRADEIRAQLEEAGILLEDKGDGTHWKVAT